MISKFGGEIVKGEVERVWRNVTSDGRRYGILQINGERYSLWDEDYLDRIQEGQILEFDFRESGDYKNISRIYDVKVDERSKGMRGEENLEYGEARLKKIIRMSCLRSASRVLTGSRIPASERAARVIEIAKAFEKYIEEDDYD